MTVMRSGISWCDSTWSPTTGCSKISAGCANCYAEGIVRRWGQRFEDVELHPQRLGHVKKFGPITEDGRRRPRMVFVNSMSDLHHEDIPDDFRHAVYDAMESTPLTIYQILTKRPGVMQRFLRDRYGNRPTPRHLWFGVSVEDNRVKKRIDVLRAAKERHNISCAFLSVEPLIGPVDECDFSDMDWVLIGGESGPRARMMERCWLDDALGRARVADAAIWFKQFGSQASNPHVAEIARAERMTMAAAWEAAKARGIEVLPSEKGGATLDGATYRESPTAFHHLSQHILYTQNNLSSY